MHTMELVRKSYKSKAGDEWKELCSKDNCVYYSSCRTE